MHRITTSVITIIMKDLDGVRQGGVRCLGHEGDKKSCEEGDHPKDCQRDLVKDLSFKRNLV